MRKYLLSMVAVSAFVAAAAPAHAQYGSGYPEYADDARGDTSTYQIERLAARLEQSVRAGAIAEYEAVPLRADLRRLRDLEYRFGRDGISRWERTELARRADSLRTRILAAERTRYGSDDGFGFPRSDVDRSDDFYDEPIIGSDDIWDDGSTYADRDSGYDSWSDPSGVDQIEPAWQDDGQPRDFDTGSDDDISFDDQDGSDPVESSDGGWDDAGADFGPALNVGDRASADLGPVPDQYRGRYRDGSGVYYRYGRGTIYQIDSATHMIRWMGILPE